MAEVLAPAGDDAAFMAALNAGADAIYLGLKDFSARKSAANFSLENLNEYTRYAHAFGVRVYVALNTLVKDAELEAFFRCAREAWNAGADALILQDIFLGKLLKETYPEIVLHLSTQAGVCNIYGARLAKRFGFSRVILARETPLDEIRSIASEIETEVFVQGALCTCFSGQCYLSSFAGGNSGNRGFCKQPCRKKYSIDRKGYEAQTYKLSLSDLCVGEDVGRLTEAGVSSFKIEGRMRSAAYVGAAVRFYRDILDGKNGEREQDFSDLKRAFNRGNYTRGLAFGQDETLISSSVQGHMGERVGYIERIEKNDKYTFIRSDFVPLDGDGFKVIREGKEEIGGGVWRSFYPRAKGGFCLPRLPGSRVGDGVYITNDTSLAARIGQRKRLIPIVADGVFKAGEAPKVVIRGAFGKREFRADFLAQEAKSRAFSKEDFCECFSKTDHFPFAVSFGKFESDGKCFLVKSAMNAFRRSIYGRIFEELSCGHASLEERTILVPEEERKPFKTENIAVIDREFDKSLYTRAHIDFAVFQPKNYKNIEEISAFLDISKYYAWHKYLYFPAFMTSEDLANTEKYLNDFDGVYSEGTYALEFCRERGIPLFAGTGFNIFNGTSARVLRREGVKHFVLSKEMSFSEISGSGCSDAFVFSGGSVKVMELCYCPFGKKCGDCDRRSGYLLKDEDGREFPLLRGENSGCRFELFNNVPLVAKRRGGMLYDFRALTEEEKEAYLTGREDAVLKGRTAGAAKRGIL